MTRSLRIDEIAENDIPNVISLWQRAGLIQPQNNPDADIRFAIAGPASTVLVARIDGIMAGAVMTGHDGHRGAIYYLGIDPDRQGTGLGRRLLGAAEGWLGEHGVWKINLMIRPDNHEVQRFYAACGYQTEERVNMSRRLDGV